MSDPDAPVPAQPIVPPTSGEPPQVPVVQIQPTAAVIPSFAGSVQAEPAPTEPVKTPRARAPGRRFSLSQAVSAAMRERHLCVADAAEAIGVAAPALRRLLLEEVKPPASALPRYAQWLGCDIALLVPSPKPPARQTAARKTRRLARKAGARARQPRPARSERRLLRLAADDLAVRLHQASPRVRRVIAAILKSLTK